ncbi:MAG: response regulator transcription factor [Actinomycetota bacterium]|nr:response regulator transcription factor [Actinomycetota bacterium]
MVVDDQEMVRAGIKMLLKPQEDIDIVAEAVDGQDAVTQARAKRPDVILMDVRMPGVDGVAATRAVVDEKLTAQNDQPIKIIILTTYHIDEAVYAALRAGASGFLLKHAIHTEIAAAIRAVVAGGAWLDPVVTRRLVDQFTAQPEHHTFTPAQMEQLTPREREVLILLARGLSNADVGRELNITENTVKRHLFNVMTKLDVREKTQAVIAAYQSGLVQTQPPQSNSSQ